jgi:signal transduction histidine kinase
MEPRYLADVRAERLIASARLTLSALTLFALWLDPAEPARNANLAYSLASLYLAYAILIAVVAWTHESRLLRWRLPTHVLDLEAYAGIIFFTSGSTSPFFAYLVFALIAAALRWHWKGVIATAAAALAAYAVIALPAIQPSTDQSTLQTFVVRSTYLTVFALLLGHLGAHHQRLRRDLGDLAAWPVSLATEPAAVAREMLERTAKVLKASDAVLLWRDRQRAHHALLRRTPTGVEEQLLDENEASGLVAPELAGRSFVTHDGRGERSEVLYLDNVRVKRWRGAALGPALRDKLPAGPVISLELTGRNVAGRLFAFGAGRFGDEDLVLGELLARQIVPQLDNAVGNLRERQAAAAAERVRLARDLHDGVIQSLTGASLRLHAVDRLLEAEPSEARRLLTEVDELLTSEQQELRWFLSESRATGDWTERLPPLLDRVARNWGLQVSMAEGPEGVLVGEFGHEVYRILQEALVNAARHGRAKSAKVEMSLNGERLDLAVSDDGCGFAFRGEVGDAVLRDQRLGPVSIKQRVGALGGELRIRSSAEGARLDIQLPIK